MKPSRINLVLVLVLSLLPHVSAAQSVDQRVDKIERELKQMQETAAFNNRRLAEAFVNFEQVREEIGTMRGEIEKLGHQSTTDMDKRQNELREMDHRLSRMEERLADIANTIRDLSVVQVDEKGKPPKKEDEAAKLLYKKAFSAMTQSQYKQAIGLFQQFEKKFPKHPLADNARFWMADSYYSMGDFQKAILEFQEVVKKYPKSDKVAGAILKQGLSFAALKSYADAKAFLEKVTIEHPKSEEAVQAREKLTEIKALISEAPSE